MELNTTEDTIDLMYRYMSLHPQIVSCDFSEKIWL